MPLHDWNDERGWDGVHLLWLSEMLAWVQDHLPEGYRAYVGSVPALTVDTTNGRPDLTVRQWRPDPAPDSAGGGTIDFAPEMEIMTTVILDPQRCIHIDLHGQLIAAIEVVSPRNKDRQSAKAGYLGRYLGYLRLGVHLLLIDVLPRPAGFSFAERIAAELGLEQPATPPPFAVSYRVGEVMPEGTLFAYRRQTCAVGEPLPMIPLALNVHQAIPIDLERTYRQAAKRAYLD